ncbi:MAG TPA: GFA family protein [Steroidobacteraceae bacterium]|jgi:hypothetical protein|nr:GFA family protein [Steroidobacteraceae bacterium]
MYKGSCLCGAIHYEIAGEIGPIDFCHCSRCRKANGTAFLSGAQVNPAEFKITSGADRLTDFESSPGVHRVFCKQCGSPLFSRRPGPPEVIRIRIGSLDTPPHGKPRAHIFYADRAEWFEFQDDVPKFGQRPT